jgi:MinD-like ATPase involved in chromosome partitioning or flagellar assembly
VVSDGSNTVLPFYFGRDPLVHRKVPGSAASDLGRSIRIFGRREFEEGLSTEGAPTELDQLVIDVEHGFHESATDRFFPVGAVVLVSVPDLRSIIHAQRLKDLYADRSPATPAISVLNKFERSIALHREIRDWFTQAFPTTVTLERSDLVSEALAEGTTVVDWAPNSELAQQYSQLLCSIQEAVTLARSPEGVAAC